VAEWVSITDEICIGCGTCARNCPYDAIVMHDTGETWPDDMVPSLLRGRDRQVASKCDLCGPPGHDPACVSNCPQGCAFRVGSVDEIRRLIADEE
jgi:Fe-S-cluster-containing hydrogenase component 2